jgi:hypothetical protein
MSAELRHYCRKCRSKLAVPVENLHHAFCTPFCHASYYRTRCYVCEEPMKRKNERRQKFPGSHGTCRSEYRRFPRAYDYPKTVKTAWGTGIVESPSEVADFVDSKVPLAPDRPPFRSLREWWWGGDGECDHSLYDRDGLTIARIVLVDGRYHLRTPVATPCPSWATIEEAKRGAESFALMAMPLDPKVAARIKRDNETPHPMGPPLNRPVALPVVEISPSIVPADFEGDPLEVPDFLRRAP